MVRDDPCQLSPGRTKIGFQCFLLEESIYINLAQHLFNEFDIGLKFHLDQAGTS